MIIRLSTDAVRDLEQGIDFYNQIRDGLGAYFYDSLAADIDSLMLYAGVHPTVDDWHYTRATRFPFVIWYGIDRDAAIVYAVLDGRMEPASIDADLRRRRQGS